MSTPFADAVRVPLHIVAPIHPAVAAVRWHFAFAESVFDGPDSALTPAHEPVLDAVFECIAIGTGAIVVQSAEFRLENDENWYPATVTQGAVRIVRVLPPLVDTVAGDLEVVE